MRTSSLGCALSLSATAALLAGCGALPQAPGDMQSPVGASGAMPQNRTAARSASLTYSVLHRFRSPQGGRPVAPLISVDGTLYGTTPYGGAYGDGTVYSITTGGVAKTLYSFRGGEYDGARPEAGLVDVDGTLYGTTFFGGHTNSYCDFSENHECGTVFTITTSGAEKILYYFQGWPDDGDNPAGGLLDVNGLLYGTTLGTNGTVYSISTSGKEKVLYQFGGGSEGWYPNGTLVDVSGTFYGTASGGGAYNGGIFYSISTSGAEKTLYSFGFSDPSSGSVPNSGLINVNGMLYGTTDEGGSSRCTYGCGTVYAITTTGTEHAVYGFGASSDGVAPTSVIDVDGTLYGTTAGGGTSNRCYDALGIYGCGTVFSLSVSGAETVLHNFTDGLDGAAPVGALLDLDGTLYGTTEYKDGPRLDRGYGTVFALTP